MAEPTPDTEKLSPQSILSKMLFEAENIDCVVVCCLLKDGTTRTGWSSSPQIMRMGLVRALQLSSDQAWIETSEDDVIDDDE